MLSCFRHLFDEMKLVICSNQSDELLFSLTSETRYYLRYFIEGSFILIEVEFECRRLQRINTRSIPMIRLGSLIFLKKKIFIEQILRLQY